jgi:outer membrane receptor for ferrienterochelin and colicins
MYMKYYRILILFLYLLNTQLSAQKITGWVKNAKDSTAIGYANITFHGTKSGIVADADGKFTFKRSQLTEPRIILSSLGYRVDTITLQENQKEIIIYLAPQIKTLNQVIIHGQQDASQMSTAAARNTQIISASGIQRLACCSLAESFENNATVDVGYSDAVSGAKHIQMLGLSGVYSQILVENQPSIRMLSSIYGLNYIPGPWLSSISISKGTSSVFQGYESLTGQINIDIKKPESSDKFYLEYFTNDYLKQEVNINSSGKINNKLSTIVLAHAATVQQSVDRNHDDFLDVPKSNLLIATNRYFYNNEKNLRSRFGFDVLYEDRTGGQVGFDPNEESLPPLKYGATLKSKRIHVFENTGFLVDADRNGSVALNANFVYHTQESEFGLNSYDPEQKSGYVTFLYNTDISSKKNKISTGLSHVYDNLEERFNDTLFSKVENVSGAFIEYTRNTSQWTAIFGVRSDYNSLYDEIFLTPRVHVKYSPAENSAIRISAGRGLRSANIIPEHLNLLTSSRKFQFQEKLKAEDGWNAGISFTQKYFLDDGRKLTFNIDFYRTEFANQVIVDLEQGVHSALFYNLRGQAYSNSFQVDAIVELISRFEITFAYRLNDSKTTMNNELIQTPLVSKHKALLALHYSTRYERWNFSFTTQYHGYCRLPDMRDNPEKYQLPGQSPDYFIFHTQVTRKFKKTEFYIGIENLSDYKQKNPIIAADDPFGPYFDSSIIYAPIIGRQLNFGFRIKIK